MNSKIKILFFVTLFLCIILAAFFSVVIKNPGLVDCVRGDSVQVAIKPGMDARSAAVEFEKKGVVKNHKKLMYWMHKEGIDRKLIPGIYSVRRGIAWFVVQDLKTQKPVTYHITLIPGMSLEDLLHSVAGKISEKMLMKALADEVNFPIGLKAYLPSDALNRIAFLMPQTYYLAPDSTLADQLVVVASKEWMSELGQLTEKTTSADLLQKSILASILEKEAKFDRERPLMAGVFINRLRIKMPLQSCATVIYSWKLQGTNLKELNYRNLLIDSPYNTYRHTGLPPTPIGIPGKSSWMAVHKPENTESLYFVARKDGSHIFSRTYEQHLAARRKIKDR